MKKIKRVYVGPNGTKCTARGKKIRHQDIAENAKFVHENRNRCDKGRKYSDEASMYNRDLQERLRNRPFRVGLNGAAGRKAKCKVVFETDSRGVDAILQPRTGTASLNLMHLGQKPTAAQKRKARARLMRGCAEMLRDRRRK
jgi:hypothetical protein